MADAKRLNNYFYWCAFGKYRKCLFKVRYLYSGIYCWNKHSVFNPVFVFFLLENISQEKVMAHSLDWHDCYHGNGAK